MGPSDSRQHPRALRHLGLLPPTSYLLHSHRLAYGLRRIRTREECMAVKEQLDRLAAFEPAPYPVVSLYLNTQPGQTGRDQFHTFVRKEFAARSKTYPAGSPERASLDTYLERISRFLDSEIDPSANGVGVFACSAGQLFEAVQL